jgi:predicted RNA-binding Zn ribbon-like protein
MITAGDKRGEPVTPLPATRTIEALPMMVGGHCVIDFINGGTRLQTSDSFVDFCLVQGLLTKDEQWRYRPAQISNPPPTISVEAVREVQESLAGLLNARIDGKKPDPIHLRWTETAIREALLASQMQMTPEGYRLAPVAQNYSYQLPIHRLTLAAMDLLEDLPRERLKRCAADGCGWIFLDTSKSGRRRWCSMSDCGNEAKQRRFRSRAAEA